MDLEGHFWHSSQLSLTKGGHYSVHSFSHTRIKCCVRVAVRDVTYVRPSGATVQALLQRWFFRKRISDKEKKSPKCALSQHASLCVPHVHTLISFAHAVIMQVQHKLSKTKITMYS